MLKAQLALSFTLTMTDEENIRQRMLEIKKARIKRASQEIEKGIIDKFEKESDQLTEPTRAKEEEEKILITRYRDKRKLCGTRSVTRLSSGCPRRASARSR